MLSVILKGHDFKYEVAELIKLFTTQFNFADRKDVGMTLENSVVYYNDKGLCRSIIESDGRWRQTAYGRKPHFAENGVQRGT